MNPVPGFLAISGFVVLGSMERRPLRQFFVSRALRILPLLAVSFGIILFVWGRSAMARNVLYWLWPVGKEPVNPVVWSLIYEEALYALLAVLFLLCVYRKAWLPVAIGFVVVLLEIYSPVVYPPRLWWFLGGAFFVGNTVYLFRNVIIRFVNKWFALAVLVLAMWISYRLPYTDIIRPGFIDFFCFAAMLVFGIAGPRLPHLKIDLSYSLYLLHCLVREMFWGVLPFGTFKFFAAVLFCTLPVCLVAWYVIEKPALSLKRYLLAPSAKPGRENDLMVNASDETQQSAGNSVN